VEVDLKTGETRCEGDAASMWAGDQPGAADRQKAASPWAWGMALQELSSRDGYTETIRSSSAAAHCRSDAGGVHLFVANGPRTAHGAKGTASGFHTPPIINAIYHATGVCCYSLPAEKK
jgi:hypothetical protein